MSPGYYIDTFPEPEIKKYDYGYEFCETCKKYYRISNKNQLGYHICPICDDFKQSNIRNINSYIREENKKDEDEIPEEKGFFTRLWEYFWDSLDLIFKKL